MPRTWRIALDSSPVVGGPGSGSGSPPASLDVGGSGGGGSGSGGVLRASDFVLVRRKTSGSNAISSCRIGSAYQNPAVTSVGPGTGRQTELACGHERGDLSSKDPSLDHSAASASRQGSSAADS